MATVEEIRAKYANHHGELSTAFYEKKHSEEGVTPQEQADFLTAHAQIWADCEAEIKTASDYVEPVSPRDFGSEIDALKGRVEQMETWKGNLIPWLKEQVGDPPEE